MTISTSPVCSGVNTPEIISAAIKLYNPADFNHYHEWFNAVQRTLQAPLSEDGRDSFIEQAREINFFPSELDIHGVCEDTQEYHAQQLDEQAQLLAPPQELFSTSQDFETSRAHKLFPLWNEVVGGATSLNRDDLEKSLRIRCDGAAGDKQIRELLKFMQDFSVELATVRTEDCSEDDGSDVWRPAKEVQDDSCTFNKEAHGIIEDLAYNFSPDTWTPSQIEVINSYQEWIDKHADQPLEVIKTFKERCESNPFSRDFEPLIYLLLQRALKLEKAFLPEEIPSPHVHLGFDYSPEIRERMTISHLESVLPDSAYNPTDEEMSEQIELQKHFNSSWPTPSEINNARDENREGLAFRSTHIRHVRQVIKDLLGLEGRIYLNQLTRNIEVCGEPLDEMDFEEAHHWFDDNFGIVSNRDAVQSSLRYIANEHSYHPVKRYLEGMLKLEPEDIDLRAVATRVLGLKTELEIDQFVAFLCGAVSKVWNEQGSKFIEVPVLISEQQGIGKSATCLTLASPQWFNASFADTDDHKDRILGMHDAWITEVQEIDQFVISRKDFKQLKGVISTVIDKLRPPYGRRPVNHARRFVIMATSNTSELFAYDDQQRRFWPWMVHPTTECGRLDIAYLNENRNRIWATATRRYLELGEDSFTLNKEQRLAVIDRNAREFRQSSSIADKIAHVLEAQDIKAITTAEVCNDILQEKAPTRSMQMEVAQVLRELGYKKHDRMIKNGFMCRSVFLLEERNYEWPRQKGNDNMPVHLDPSL